MTRLHDDGAAALVRARARSASAAAHPDDWWTLGEAAERLGVSTVTLRRAAERGDVNCTRGVETGYYERFEPAALLGWARRLRLIA